MSAAVVIMRITGIFLLLMLLTPSLMAADAGTTVVVQPVAEATAIPLLVLASSRRTKAANAPMTSETTERLISYLAAESGIRFQLQPVPWNRAVMMAMRGEAAIYGLSRTAEREQVLDYSMRVYSEEVLLVTRHDKAFEFRSLDDLRGKRVGVQLGGSYDDEFEYAKNRLFIVDENANGATARMRQLLAGRIDVAVYGNGRTRLQRLLARSPNGSKDFAILTRPLTHNERYFAFPKQTNAAALLQRLNAAIARGIRSGRIDAILSVPDAPDSENASHAKSDGEATP